ncbi:hypothetical protein [Tahibacter sp.]|uniref:hypothetical protein n=1 Tax=Tahibacter sp. TaxID=2056211 RepID=UPI0028C3E6C7|nr:hypothetical protein [Tahibacter sp.]
MSQDLVSLSFTAEQLAAADAAITQLETIFAGFIALTPDERRSLNRMGNQSKPFCENTILMMEQNLPLIPPILNPASARQDMLALQQISPLLDRLERLTERGSDTEAALGSDIMALALAGYGALGVAGKGQGLDSLRKQLSVRFAKTRRKPDTADKAKTGKTDDDAGNEGGGTT